MPSPRLTSVADVTQDQAQRTGPKHQCIIGLRQRGSPPYTISARLFLRLALPSPAAGLTWLRANGVFARTGLQGATVPGFWGILPSRSSSIAPYREYGCGTDFLY